ncbi:MAG: DUF1707 domain-containing protein [Propionibacteriaceae bacterium]|nr:DUF1707 domain-containing protein [Propionibacteriaceae bacterium]
MNDIRASHADRERYFDILKEAYAEGRIDTAEMDVRLQQISEAKTYRDLDAVVRDLPGQQVAPTGQTGRRGLLTAVGVAALTGAGVLLWPRIEGFLMPSPVEPAPVPALPPPSAAAPAPVETPAPEPSPTGPTLEAEPTAANPTVGPITGPVTSDAGKLLVSAIGWLQDKGYERVVRIHFHNLIEPSMSVRYRRLDDPSLEDYIVVESNFREYPSGPADDRPEIDVATLQRLNIDEMQRMALEALGGQKVLRVDLDMGEIDIEVEGDDYGRGAGTVTFDGAGTEMIQVEPRQ